MSSLSVFGGVRVARSLVFCAVFCRLFFLLLSFFFWPLCCLSFFYLRIPTTALVSSNSFRLVHSNCVRRMLQLGPFTLQWRMIFEFQCKGYEMNIQKYHIFEIWIVRHGEVNRRSQNYT